MRDFICLHKFGSPILFKPSVAEVLSQFPSDLLNSANYFEIIESPTNVDDLNMYNYVTTKSYHLSKVMTYNLK